ncbi:hypothetical protein MERGE_000796 [Pneumocystis wakefieldiae]|uniref:Prefoldin, alpha subunit n=1 Tax=Pneumocystis wakefieldiae TaxID=38082 RepID=A0A899G0Q1_9ASCO|nr:hypothetical protein MERGE_000796 [Pneumocystis wakefieldiae]
MSINDNLNSPFTNLKKYTSFMNNVLQPKLYSLIKEREELDKSLSEYFKLKSHILQIQNEKLNQMKIMVDIGSNFYAQTKIENTSKIIVFAISIKGLSHVLFRFRIMKVYDDIRNG